MASCCDCLSRSTDPFHSYLVSALAVLWQMPCNILECYRTIRQCTTNESISIPYSRGISTLGSRAHDNRIVTKRNELGNYNLSYSRLVGSLQVIEIPTESPHRLVRLFVDSSLYCILLKITRQNLTVNDCRLQCFRIHNFQYHL